MRVLYKVLLRKNERETKRCDNKTSGSDNCNAFIRNNNQVSRSLLPATSSTIQSEVLVLVVSLVLVRLVRIQTK